VVYDMSRELEYQAEPVASAAPASETKTVSEVEWVTYKVKTGDSLGKIANKYKTTTTQLKKWNKMRSNTIHPGQKLKVKQTVHKTVAKDDQAKVENTKEEEEEEAVAENKPQPVKELTKPKETSKSNPSYKYHTVQRGDTLWAIANKYDGVTVDSIKNLNKGIGSNLKVGQKIKLKQVG
jgi:membrane-bound lytic murein transglycosylase D